MRARQRAMIHTGGEGDDVSSPKLRNAKPPEAGNVRADILILDFRSAQL